MDLEEQARWQAQDMQTAMEHAALWGKIYMIVMLVMYVYLAYSLYLIAKKTSTENGWLAWVPIIQLIILPLMIAKKPLWWAILFLVPIANLVIAIIVWMKIAEVRGKPAWMGILMLVPGVNVAIPGYLAFSK